MEGSFSSQTIFTRNIFKRSSNLKTGWKEIAILKRRLSEPSQRLQFISENVTSNLCEMEIFNSILLHYWKLGNIAFLEFMTKRI